MAKRSLPDVSAKFIADVEGMLRDLKRADDATRSTTSNIDREVDKLSRNLKRKFSAGDIGKDILRGLGLGSGFAVAQTAAEQVSKYYQQAAESAQKIQEYSQRSLDAFNKRMALGRSPQEELESLRKEKDRLYRELADANRTTSVTRYYTGREGERRAVTSDLPFSNEQVQRQHELGALINENALKIAELEKKAKDVIVQEASSDRDRRIKALTESLRQQEQAFDGLIKKRSQDTDKTEDQVKANDDLMERYLQMSNPLRQYEQDLQRLMELQKTSPSTKLTEAIEALNQAMEDARMKWVDQLLKDELGGILEQSRDNIENLNRLKTVAESVKDELNQMWNSVSDRAGQAFADMVLSGEAAFSDLVNIVARSVLEMIARLAIINPILNMLFGGMSGYGMLPAFFGAGATPASASASYAGAFATGGTLEPGTWGIAGEHGPEPIFAGSAPLTVIPNGATKAKVSGDSFSFTYHIGSGVTREQLLPILKAQQRDTIARITEARMRGSNPLAFA